MNVLNTISLIIHNFISFLNGFILKSYGHPTKNNIMRQQTQFTLVYLKLKHKFLNAKFFSNKYISNNSQKS